MKRMKATIGLLLLMTINCGQANLLATQDESDFQSTFNHAVNLFKQQHSDEAITWFKKALKFDPEFAPSHFNLGLLYTIKQELDTACTCFEKATHYDNNHLKAHYFLACNFVQQGNFEKAIETYFKALRIDPRHIESHIGLAKTMRDNNEIDQSIAWFLRTLDLEPSNIHIRFDLANLYHILGDYDRSIEHFRILLDTHPNLADVHCNLGHSLRGKGEHREAITHYQNALNVHENNPTMHYGLAESYLATGNIFDGFREFEWRWKRAKDTRKFGEKLWDGSDPAGKIILLRAEYGQGDTIQFIRYARLLKERGARIIVESQHTLVPLLSLCNYIDEIIVVKDPVEQLPTFDFQIPLMSLPYAFGTTRETIPSDIPYLKADHVLVEQWKEKLANDKNIKIGICWEGSPYYESFKPLQSKKAVPLETFVPLARLEGVSIYSLQKMNGLDQLQQLPEDITIHSFGPEFDITHGRFMDTAAVIENLDLVVTVDTSVAHLAGSLGKPVWVILPQVADWRWMEPSLNPTMRDKNGQVIEGSLWYPTMRLFRQKQPGKWLSVMQHIVEEVAIHVTTQPSRNKCDTITSDTIVTSEIATGELVDKITILQIKMEKITNPEKLANVERELKILSKTHEQHMDSSSELAALTSQLLDVNKKLWNIEDDIRDKERLQEFDDEFIQLARSVYFTNDERCRLKREINTLSGSRIVEEKSYTDYTNNESREEIQQTLTQRFSCATA